MQRIKYDNEPNDIQFYKHKHIEIVSGESSHSFPPHNHNALCIGVVTGGKLLLEINKQTFILEKNHIYIIPPLVAHQMRAIDQGRYEYTVACLHSEFSIPYRHAVLSQYAIADNQSALDVLAVCQGFIKSGNCALLEKEFENFLSTNTRILNHSNRRNNHSGACSAAQFILEHLEEPFDLSAVAKHTHLSKYHLLRLFKQQIGLAPYQFYLQEKVRRIKQGLLRQQSPVDLAYQLQFSDQSHLCNTFKKHIGLSPAQFRKKYHDPIVREEQG